MKARVYLNNLCITCLKTMFINLKIIQNVFKNSTIVDTKDHLQTFIYNAIKFYNFITISFEGDSLTK